MPFPFSPYEPGATFAEMPPRFICAQCGVEMERTNLTPRIEPHTGRIKRYDEQWACGCGLTIGDSFTLSDHN